MKLSTENVTLATNFVSTMPSPKPKIVKLIQVCLVFLALPKLSEFSLALAEKYEFFDLSGVGMMQGLQPLVSFLLNSFLFLNNRRLFSY